MKLYTKYVKKNICNLKNKKVVITGATGGIAYYIIRYLLELDADIIMGVRNINKALILKTNLLKIYPNANIYIEYIDMALFETIDEFVLNLSKYNEINYLINNAGIYHLKPHNNPNGLEIHFATNYYGPYLLTKKMLPILNLYSGKVITIGSIAYFFAKLNISDIYSVKVRNRTKVYGITKKLLMLEMLYFKENSKFEYPNVKFDLVQPGITASTLFDSLHGGFSKGFGKIIVPLMHLIFFKTSKSALSAIYAINHDANFSYWFGPRGLFHVWGYPGLNKLRKNMLNFDLINEVNEITKGIIKNA